MAAGYGGDMNDYTTASPFRILDNPWISRAGNAAFAFGVLAGAWRLVTSQTVAPWWVVAMLALGLLLMLAPHVRSVVRRFGAQDEGFTRDPTLDYEIIPGVTIPPDSAWDALPKLLTPPSIGHVVDCKLVAVEAAPRPIPDGFPQVRMYASGGARLNAYPKVTTMSVWITNCGDKAVSLGFRLFQPMDGVTPMEGDGLARDRVELTPIVPDHEDRIMLAPGESGTVERVYFWSLTDVDLAATSSGFARDLVLEVRDHASMADPIEFSMGYWP